jgi:hypothetical protein
VTAEAAFSAGIELDHHEARERWGEPDAWTGSVNDPRTREENGIRFNEKWIYFLHGGDQRWVYWHRYACRGVLRLCADGVLQAEPL